MRAHDVFEKARFNLTELGKRVRQDRMHRDLSQTEYARMLSRGLGETIDVPQLSRIERGQLVPSPLLGQAITTLFRENHLQCPQCHQPLPDPGVTPNALDDPAD